MTIKEAIKLKLEYHFEKVTLTTTQTGDDKVYHYFTITINGVTLHLAPDDNKPEVWFGSIFNHPIKFYAIGSFKALIKSLQDGEWDEQ